MADENRNPAMTENEPLRQVIARILLDRNAGDDWMGDPVTWEAASEGLRDLFRAQADIVIGRVLSEAFDATLLDFGAWLAEELTGQPISPVDLQSCLEDWKG